MESVEKQIAELLERNDCVQVPDFGGFVLNKKSALFGTHANELLAPGKSISFNRNLQMNDGLLCSHICSSRKMLYAEAQKLIAEKVRDWKNILAAGHVLHLENIGTLQQDGGQKLQFSPFSLKNFDLKAYGLSALQLKPVDQETYSEKLEKSIKTKSKSLPQGRKVWLQRTVYSTIAAATLILGFLVFDQINFNLNNYALSSIAQTQAEKPASPEKTTSEISTENNLTENNTSENNLSLQPEQALEENTTASNSKYYVIGGSFSSDKNANNFAQQLEKKGYKAEVLDNENGFFRVAYIEEADSLTADRHLQQIKQQENQAAWILKW